MRQVQTRLDNRSCAQEAEIKVWDIAVRVFHWSLASAFFFAWITAEEWDKAHEVIGYGIAGLVFFRLFWGVFGSQYAKFSNFVTEPATVFSYLKDSLYLRSKRYIGHNPAGGAMIIMLLASVIIVVATGHIMTLNMFWGSEWVEDLHEVFASLTLCFVVFHVVGVLFSSFAHKENLVKSMITGRKRAD